MVSACAVPPPPGASEPAPTPAAVAEVPQSGGALRLAFNAEVTPLDPHRAWTFPDLVVAKALYEALVWEDAGDAAFTVRPRLAESWESSDDGLVWTFNLRSDVHFAHGTPLTAADVVFSFIDRALNPEMGFAFAQSISYIDGVEAVNDQTVRFSLSKPSTTLLRDFANVPIAP